MMMETFYNIWLSNTEATSIYKKAPSMVFAYHCNRKNDTRDIYDNIFFRILNLV